MTGNGAAAESPAQEIEPGLWLRPGTPPLRLADFGLVAFDMDSTLIDMECIDEIAAEAGRKAEVAAITEAAMRGEITDYQDSLRRRLALLRGVPVSALDAVLQRLRMNPGVERFVAACRGAGLKTLLVSGGFTFFSEPVRQRLQLDFARANTLAVEAGRLTGELVQQPWGRVVDGAEKRRVMLELADLLGLPAARCIAVGDGANDLPMMEAAGLSIAFHAKPAVQARAALAISSGGMDRALGVLRA
ncbi:MAG: phosphoserine phosphatase SerB [Rubrivivax sp.]|nr:phosphoserine phosphatase SerB [Rubrivivax sp.]